MRDNYYETAITSLDEAIKGLGPSAKTSNPAMYYLGYGILRMAQGLLQESKIVEHKLDEILARLPPRQ
jgi:hypothetical protein